MARYGTLSRYVRDGRIAARSSARHLPRATPVARARRLHRRCGRLLPGCLAWASGAPRLARLARGESAGPEALARGGGVPDRSVGGASAALTRLASAAGWL
jgi:hypothetical protein